MDALLIMFVGAAGALIFLAIYFLVVVVALVLFKLFGLKIFEMDDSGRIDM